MSRPPKGMALIEALIAAAILGVGLLGATQLTLRTLQTAIDTRQRHVAQTLAEEALDCVASGGLCSVSETLDIQGVRYTRTVQLTPFSPGLMDVRVTVDWASAAALSATPRGHAPWSMHTRVRQVPEVLGP